MTVGAHVDGPAVVVDEPVVSAAEQHQVAGKFQICPHESWHLLSGRQLRNIHGVYADHIVADHRVMGGVPCIRGTRVPAATVVGLIAEGIAAEGIVSEYPQLTLDDVRAALEFAAAAVNERQLPLRIPA